MNLPLSNNFKRIVTVPRLLAVALIASAGTLFATATFTPANQPTGWMAQAEVSDFNLISGAETVYETDFERQNYSGNIYAYPVDASGVIDKPAERWTGGAADNIDAQNYNTGRTIFTLKSDGTRIPFRWASLAAAQQTALGGNTNGSKILDFVRGDRSNENPNGAKFRARVSTLGDMIHSRPYYVEGATNSTVYVGANDGMLHAINASNGNERYAYVPSMLISQLPNLAPIAPTAYTHTYFVDASPNSAMATISGVSKRILVGGLGAGGKGIYALDITGDSAGNPTSETSAAAKILWEITDSTINNATSNSYAKLGYTYGVPVIAAVNGSAQTAVIMGNGYLNSGGGTAVLYVIDAGTGALMRAIDTASGTNASPNGLSSPTAIDTNGDGKVDYVYAGDIDGNLWKFDLTSASAASWTATKLYTTSPAQSITGAPAVSAHPAGGYMINFGTGRTFTAGDITDTSVFSAYGIRDSAPAGATTILTQTLTAATYTYGTGSLRVRTATSNAADWTTHKGWKVALPAGERIVGDGTFVANGRYYFNSYNPTVNTSVEPTGENWLHELDYLTGGSRSTPFLDLNGDLVVNDADRLKNASNVNLAGSAGVAVAKLLGAGVTSQPLLVQLSALNTTLFNSNPDISAPPPPPTGRGVTGGHFDVDIYYPICTTKNNVTTCNGFQSQKHYHQYDKTFNVTGVDMQNASDPSLNFSNAIANTSTPFKILVMNQFLNPAVTLNIGGAGYVSVKTYGVLASESNAATLLASLPTYTRSNLGTLYFNMPVNAFSSLNWWGSGGDVRAGLIPTATGCVHGMSSTNLDPTPGIQGERHDGALTIQFIKPTTPSTALELNVAGKPEYGWRVKQDANWTTYVLAEYTTFWHSSVGCYTTANSSWTQSPGPDSAGGNSGSNVAAGSDDPRSGSFFPTSAVATVTTTSNNNVTTTVTTYVDHTRTTVTKTVNADGSVTTSTVNPDGSTNTNTTVNPAGTLKSGGDEKRLQAQTGRISWHELLAP